MFDDEQAFVLEVAITWQKGESLKRTYQSKKLKYETAELRKQLNAKLDTIQPSANGRKITVIPLVFSVQGSYYDPSSDWTLLVNRMAAVKSLKKCLLVGAQIAFELSLKFLGKVLGDRNQYSNVRMT